MAADMGAGERVWAEVSELVLRTTQEVLLRLGQMEGTGQGGGGLEQLQTTGVQAQPGRLHSDLCLTRQEAAAAAGGGAVVAKQSSDGGLQSEVAMERLRRLGEGRGGSGARSFGLQGVAGGPDRGQLEAAALSRYKVSAQVAGGPADDPRLSTFSLHLTPNPNPLAPPNPRPYANIRVHPQPDELIINSTQVQ
jgi:hypothetical protein